MRDLHVVRGYKSTPLDLLHLLVREIVIDLNPIVHQTWYTMWKPITVNLGMALVSRCAMVNWAICWRMELRFSEIYIGCPTNFMLCWPRNLLALHAKNAEKGDPLGTCGGLYKPIGVYTLPNVCVYDRVVAKPLSIKGTCWLKDESLTTPIHWMNVNG